MSFDQGAPSTTPLLPLLPAIVRLVERKASVSEDQLEILLMASGVEGSENHLHELAIWARLLERVRDATSADMDDVVVEGLVVRGVPEDQARGAVASLSKDRVRELESAAYDASGSTPASVISVGRLADLAVGPDGTVYVADSERHCIYCLSPDLTLMRTLGPDLGEGVSLASPTSLDVGSTGILYVMSTIIGSGLPPSQPLYRIARHGEVTQLADCTRTPHYSGLPPGLLTFGLCTGGTDLVYVLGLDNIGRFRDTGSDAVEWDSVVGWNGFHQRKLRWLETLPPGTSLRSITEGLDGDVYVATSGGSLVQMIPDGDLVDGWQREPGHELGEFHSLAVDSEGQMFLVEDASDYVIRADVKKDSLYTLGGSGNEPGSFREPRALAIDTNGNLYVADTGNRRIQKFDPNGSVIAIWPQLATLETSQRVTSSNAPSSGRVHSVNRSRVRLIDRLRAAAPGEAIELEAGDYELDEGVHLSDPITILGQGADRTRIVMRAEMSTGVIMIASDSSSFQLRDVTLELDIPRSTPGDDDNLMSGILLAVGAGTAEIERCAFVRRGDSPTGRGLVFVRDASGKVRECVVRGHYIGIDIQDSVSLLLEGNTCSGNAWGISYTGGSGACRENRCVSNVEVGIVVGGDAAPRLEANVCSDNEGTGIQFMGLSEGQAYDNTCERNRLNGISIQGAARPEVHTNRCSRNRENGIAFMDKSSGRCVKNRCADNAYGIAIQRGANPALEENFATGNSHEDVYDERGRRGWFRR